MRGYSRLSPTLKLLMLEMKVRNLFKLSVKVNAGHMIGPSALATYNDLSFMMKETYQGQLVNLGNR